MRVAGRLQAPLRTADRAGRRAFAELHGAVALARGSWGHQMEVLDGFRLTQFGFESYGWWRALRRPY